MVYFVRMLGDPDDVRPVPVHWKRLRRFAGKEFLAPASLIRSAQHDRQVYHVAELLGWRVGEDGVEVKVKWRGFELQDATWEPLQQLREDVPQLVRQFLREHAHESPVLESALATL